jgi:hypothetical protein
MDTSDDFKLILNHINHGEYEVATEKEFGEYTQMAFLFLNHKGKRLFEKDLLDLYREGMTIERLLSQEEGRFIQGSNVKVDGKMQKTWYDIASTDEVGRGDSFFDYFFSCRMRHISLQDIDAFLDFHLKYSFGDDKKTYFRFLNIIMRQYEERILSPRIMDTVREWMKMNDLETGSEELSGKANGIRTKNKAKRDRNDDLTKLNQEQTALLIHFLQAGKIILKDENLNNKEAGQAFSLLTGFSADSLRQNLSKEEIVRISNKKNFDAVSNALTSLQLMISRELKEKIKTPPNPS